MKKKKKHDITLSILKTFPTIFDHRLDQIEAYKLNLFIYLFFLSQNEVIAKVRLSNFCSLVRYIFLFDR